MDKTKILRLLKRKNRFNFLVVLMGALFMGASVSGVYLIVRDPKITIFGDKIGWIEKRLLKHKAEIGRIVPVTEKEKELKDASLQYLELCLTQDFMARLLIDFGFLGFLFWLGMMTAAIPISFYKFTKQIEKLIQEE